MFLIKRELRTSGFECFVLCMHNIMEAYSTTILVDIRQTLAEE